MNFDVNGDSPVHTVARTIQAQIRHDKGCSIIKDGSVGFKGAGRVWRCDKCGEGLFTDANVLPAVCAGELQGDPSYQQYSNKGPSKNDKVKKAKKKQDSSQVKVRATTSGDETLLVEPLPWMIGPDEPYGTTGGRINCPECQNKLGSFKWLQQAVGTSRWPSPGWQMEGCTVPCFAVSRKKLR